MRADIPSEGTPRFEARSLGAAYRRGGRVVPVFENASFSLGEGEICDIVGPSGSGKSTLLRICALMMEKTSGELFVDGTASSECKPAEWRRRVCLVPQKPSLIPGTVKDNLLLAWSMRIRSAETPPSDAALRELLDAVGLAGEVLSRNASQLSGGQQARVALVRSFATRPRVLLLDEADAALDDASSAAVGDLTARIAAQGTAILRVRHRASDGLATRTLRVENALVEQVRP